MPGRFGGPGLRCQAISLYRLSVGKTRVIKPPMRADTIRHHFASDNTAAICPEAWTALEQANADYAPSYGEDEWTAKVCERVRDLFEVDCDVYFVFTGTGANALGLAQICEPFHGVICHERAHIQTDEAGAMEFYTG